MPESKFINTGSNAVLSRGEFMPNIIGNVEDQSAIESSVAQQQNFALTQQNFMQSSIQQHEKNAAGDVIMYTPIVPKKTQAQLEREQSVPPQMPTRAVSKGRKNP